MIPSNLRGAAASQLPPAGTPNYFVSESQLVYAYEVRKFTAGANCGGGGSLSAATNVSQTSYNFTSGNYVPQPGAGNTLDVIDDRLMQKVQYRKVGSAESLGHSQRCPDRLYQYGDAMGADQRHRRDGWTTPVQQGIHRPDTTLHRWMGSIAADNQGNVALAYSTSNGTAPNYPASNTLDAWQAIRRIHCRRPKRSWLPAPDHRPTPAAAQPAFAGATTAR